ncbi:MAG: glucosamine-6-phosphate deaminase [Defluviitaleaceae bacterium]|nr:glucosamine-6-phosphate deaminase [Defluviitaleaceae bacterium]
MRIEIENDYQSMGRKGAQLLAQAMKENPSGAFGFATGSTPISMYQALVQMHKEDGLDFSGISTFNLDEYHPIARESDQSYYYFMQQELFGQVNVDASRIFIPDGMAADPAAEGQAYEEKIQAAGGIVMQILGIGLNGHIGFNEPSDCFEANTRHVPLAEMTITSNARHFDSPDDVPRHALTMGIRSIMMAKHILLLANGSPKAGILRDALLGPITPLVPASALQLHPSVIVVADKEAASLL